MPRKRGSDVERDIRRFYEDEDALREVEDAEEFRKFVKDQWGMPSGKDLTASQQGYVDGIFNSIYERTVEERRVLPTGVREERVSIGGRPTTVFRSIITGRFVPVPRFTIIRVPVTRLLPRVVLL